MIRSISLKETFSQVLRASCVEKGYMILLLITIFPLTYKILSPVFILTGLGNYTQYITGVLYVIGVIMAFPLISRTIRTIDVLFYLCFVIFFIISQVFYPSSEEFVGANMHDILLCIVPVFFLGLLVNYNRDKYLIKNTFRIAFLIAIFWEACLMVGLVEGSSDSAEIGEQMDEAYYLLLINCYMLFEYNNSHDKFELFAFIMGTLMLLFMGTRGPVVLLGLFFIVYSLFFLRFKKNNIIKKTALILFLTVFCIFSTPLMLALSVVATQIGMSTKVFDSFLKGNLINLESSSGRDIIYDAMYDAIKMDPTGFGYGFGGDRLFSPSGGYAHNLILEVLVEFGYIGGGIFFLLLTIITYRAYRKVRGTPSAEFMLVVFFWGIMSLLFSKSWLIHTGFFFLIGYYVSISRSHKLYYNN